MRTNKLVLLTPVLDDWDSLYILLQEIKSNLAKSQIDNYSVLIVNDFSSTVLNKEKFTNLNIPIQIINLKKNLGHQRAIASGLSYINKNLKSE